MSKKTNNSRFARQGGVVQRMNFHSIGRPTLSSGTSQLSVSPSLFSRAASIADTYALYRFVELDFRLHPDSTLTGMQTAAFLPGVTDAPPANFGNAGEVIKSVALGARATVPTEWVRCNMRDLSSYMSWYKTIAGTPDADVEAQGLIALTGSSADVVCYEIRAVIEFRDPVASANTPMVKEQLMRKERERILKVLAIGLPVKQEPTSPIGSRQLTG
jgi:hypothetical protein